MTGAWEAHDVPAMWVSAQGADTQTAWGQVRAWQATHDLLTEYSKQLTQCCEELTAAWPPEESPAAQAFVTYMRQLVLSIDTAAADAATNQGALHRVLDSLVATKTDFDRINAQWQYWAGAGPAPVVGPVNMSYTIPAAGWQQLLTVQARERMAQNDREVTEATGQMTVPNGYSFGEPRKPVDGGQTSDDGARTGAGWMHPPLMGGGSRSDEAHVAGVAITQPSSSATGLGGVPTVGDFKQGSATSPLPGGSPVVGVAGPVTTVGGSGGVHPVSATPFGGRRIAPSTFGGGGAPGGQRVTAPGGVIGAPTGQTPFGGAPIGSRGGAGQNRSQPDGDQYIVWEVNEGVSPVIEAPVERPHDPGPGVIGIDR